MSYVTTGKGEAALMNVPQVHPSAAAPRSQFPSTLFISNGQLPTRNYYMQMHAKFGPPVQAWETNSNTQTVNLPAEESLRARDPLIRDLFRVGFGIIMCAIPLAVVSTLYGQQQASSSSSSPSMTATVAANISMTNFTLPSQCTSYTINNDSTRNVAYGSGTSCDNTLTTGWYRFMGGAGTQLATAAVSTDFCATSNTGFYKGSLPITTGSVTFGTLCLNYMGYTCYASWSGSLISITNCNTYYVYYLLPITNCASRYCTTA